METLSASTEHRCQTNFAEEQRKHIAFWRTREVRVESRRTSGGGTLNPFMPGCGRNITKPAATEHFEAAHSTTSSPSQTSSLRLRCSGRRVGRRYRFTTVRPSLGDSAQLTAQQWPGRPAVR